jgi:hypothetical protein
VRIKVRKTYYETERRYYTYEQEVEIDAATYVSIIKREHDDYRDLEAWIAEEGETQVEDWRAYDPVDDDILDSDIDEEEYEQDYTITTDREDLKELLFMLGEREAYQLVYQDRFGELKGSEIEDLYKEKI